MIITLSDKEGNPVIMIKPMNDGLNYQIFKKTKGVLKDGVLYYENGKKLTSEWVFTNCYCQSIEHALFCGIEKFLIESPTSTTIKITGNVYKKLKDHISSLVKDIAIEVEKEVDDAEQE